MTNRNDKKTNGEFKGTGFRYALIGIIILLVAVRLINDFVYPETRIIPPDLFFAVAIAEIFMLWFYEVKEKHTILWVQKRKDDLAAMKEKFMNVTSHELNTPVTVIKGYHDLLKEEVLGELTGDQKSALEVTQKYLNRLGDIRNKLARLYLGTYVTREEEMKPGSVQELIRVTASDIEPFIRQRNQTMALEIEEDIPPVVMDAEEIRQVLVNLLLNAIRFTPDQGRIVVRARDEGESVRVEVEDNGIGIPAGKQHLIFESFFAAGDTAEHTSGTIKFKSGGLGLGLTIAKHIIDAHNGKIWAESEQGTFTRLIFTLPKQIG